jgi:GDP-D-mannose dehydratase
VRPSVHLDPHYLRPTKLDLLLGDASKARQKLNWPSVESVECREVPREGPVE